MRGRRSYLLSLAISGMMSFRILGLAVGHRHDVRVCFHREGQHDRVGASFPRLGWLWTTMWYRALLQ